MRVFLSASTAIIAAVLAACGDEPTGSVGPTIGDFRVTPNSASLTGVGATQTFTASISDSSGNQIGSMSITWSSLNPHVVTIDAESGEATAVASGQAAIAASAADTVVYALVTVAVPGLPSVTTWTATTIQGIGFHNIWGASPDDVFAVGSDVAGSAAIAHYDGTGWQVTIPDPTALTLRGVGGTSSSDVFAVGDGGVILHYDGTAWAAMQSGTSSALLDVWAAAPNDVVIIGSEGGFRYDGQAWTPMEDVTSYLWGVWGTSSEDVHTVGTGGIRDVWGSSPTHVFQVGSNGQILHFDGSEPWTPMSSGTDRFLFGVWGTSSSDVYAVGADGTIRHYDGSAWNSIDGGTASDLWKVWTMSSGDVFVVTRLGLVLRGTR
jgi:hypothetical protein